MKGPWLSVWPCLQKVAMHVSKNVPSGLISSHPLSLLLWEVNVDPAHRAQLSLRITIRSQILQILNSPDSHTFALVTNRLRTLKVTILWVFNLASPAGQSCTTQLRTFQDWRLRSLHEKYSLNFLSGSLSPVSTTDPRCRWVLKPYVHPLNQKEARITLAWIVVTNLGREERHLRTGKAFTQLEAIFRHQKPQKPVLWKLTIRTASPAMKLAISHLGVIRRWSWWLRPQAWRWWLTSRHRGTSHKCHKCEVKKGLDHSLLPINGLIIHGCAMKKPTSSGLISSHPLSLLLWEVNVDQAHRAQLSLRITARSQILPILNSPDSHTFALVTNRLRTLKVTILWVFNLASPAGQSCTTQLRTFQDWRLRSLHEKYSLNFLSGSLSPVSTTDPRCRWVLKPYVHPLNQKEARMTLAWIVVTNLGREERHLRTGKAFTQREAIFRHQKPQKPVLWKLTIRTASPAMKLAISRLGVIRRWSWCSDHQLGGDDLHLVTMEHLTSVTSVKWKKVLTTVSSQYMVSSSMAVQWKSWRITRYHSCSAWIVKLPPWKKKYHQSFEWQALKNCSLNWNHNCGFRFSQGTTTCEIYAEPTFLTSLEAVAKGVVMCLTLRDCAILFHTKFAPNWLLKSQLF